MAEKEYIEREAALDRIREYIEEYGEPEENGLHNLKWCAMMEAEMVLTDLPAADVRFVVRGKWLGYQQGRWVYAKCSECGTVHDVRSNYCPNCGADMREES